MENSSINRKKTDLQLTAIYLKAYAMTLEEYAAGQKDIVESDVKKVISSPSVMLTLAPTPSRN